MGIEERRPQDFTEHRVSASKLNRGSSSSRERDDSVPARRRTSSMGSGLSVDCMAHREADANEVMFHSTWSTFGGYMSKGIRFSGLILLFVCISIPLTGLGQTTGSTLTGQVTDHSGAAIPNATVTAENTGTSLTVQSKTDAQGVYRISPLPPGRYALTVAASGFSTYIQHGITLSVGVAATQNVSLQVGAEQQTVNVVANAALINTTSPAIGMTINEESVTQLPLNGRDPQSLVFLAPGTTNGTAYGIAYNQADFTFPEDTGASSGVGAGRAGSTFYLLDGASNTDDYTGLANPFPNADATREFTVITNNFSAKYGYAPGAVVLIETKSGTNSWHGGAWEFLRNQGFNASDWFSHQVNPLHQNQFGVDLGGPILRKKLFFFANYQGTDASSASTSAFEYTYTAAMLKGDFSAIPETLNAPFGTVNGVPNQINPALFNQAALKILPLIMPESSSPNGQLYYSTGTQLTDYNEGTGRIDYTISPSQRLFLRAYINYYNHPASGVPGNISTYTPPNPMEDYNVALGHTWLINQKAVNVATLYDTQIDSTISGQAIMSNGQAFCWSEFINVNEPPGTCSTEGLTIAGSSSYFYGPYVEPCEQDHGNYGLNDDVSIEDGRHNLTFGINLQHRWINAACDYPAQPIIDFDGQYTNYAMADFLLGDMASMTQGAGAYGTYNDWQFGLYAEDSFRYSPGVTFQLGLRWDPNFPLALGAGRAATFVAGQQSVVYPDAPVGLVFPGDAGVGPGLMQTQYGYWEPRLGVAWQPRSLPRTSFHGGFGLFTGPQLASQDDHTTNNSPFAPTFTLNGTATTPLSLDNPWSGFAGTGGESPFPPFASYAYRPPPSVTFTPGLAIPDALDPKARLGMTQAWNVAAEQQLGPNSMVRVAYVGSESYHQMITVDRNPGLFPAGGSRTEFPNLGQILYNESAGTASYNGLEVTVDHHMARGLQFQSNWTWSKLIDTASSANLGFGYQTMFDPFNIDRSRGISLVSFPFIWVSNAIYTTPGLTQHNQLVRQTLGGWEISAIITSQSGQPFTVYGGFGNNNSQSLQYADHADRVPGTALDVRSGGKSHWLNDYFNIDAFTENPAGTFGNTGKDIMRGAPYNNIDAGLDKNWKIFDKYALQFRWEMFNALNHPNFGLPNATNQIGSNGANAGGTEGQIISMFGSPRIMQGALKLTF
ncbi:MAG: carboxypeptidase regulatory-like domain-containing protein [Acidobacteriaceae bacterium]